MDGKRKNELFLPYTNFLQFFWEKMIIVMSNVINTVEKPKSGRRITPTYYGFLSLESDKHEHKQ